MWGEVEATPRADINWGALRIAELTTATAMAARQPGAQVSCRSLSDHARSAEGAEREREGALYWQFNGVFTT